MRSKKIEWNHNSKRYDDECDKDLMWSGYVLTCDIWHMDAPTDMIYELEPMYMYIYYYMGGPNSKSLQN